MNEIICFSSEPWHALPTRTQQLISRLKGAKVLYFQPYASHSGREEGRELRPGLTVYTLPRALTADPSSRLYSLSAGRQAAFVQRKLARHRFRAPTAWATDPDQLHLIRRVPHDALIYDCQRYWPEATWPEESALTQAADVVFAASPELAQHLEPCSRNIVLLPNGANCAPFLRRDLPAPQELMDLPGPVLGWTGAIHADLDLSPLLYAARERPNWTFVLVGRVGKNPYLPALTALPNVVFTGQRPLVELPDFVTHFHVCLNFLRRSEELGAVVPSRIYEYLASGRPIVSMFAPGQIERFPDVIYGAYGEEDFLSLCSAALAETGLWAPQRRQERARQATWAVRAGQVRQILTTIGLLSQD